MLSGLRGAQEMTQRQSTENQAEVPNWVPKGAVVYLAHVEKGRSIRSLAREAGCHASTILRRVRRFETRRDDLLIDLALRRLGQGFEPSRSNASASGGTEVMQAMQAVDTQLLDDDELRKVAPRLLRRLNETGACLAIARDMDKAVIVRETGDGQSLRTAVFDRPVAEAMALNDWIAPCSEGRITRYRITSSGRMALKRFLAEDEAIKVGLGETADPYSEQHRDWAERASDTSGTKKRGIRYNAAESPLSALARRKDKDGKVFLSPDLGGGGRAFARGFRTGADGSTHRAKLGQVPDRRWSRHVRY